MATDQEILENKLDLDQIVNEVKNKEVVNDDDEEEICNKEGENNVQTTITTTVYGALDNRATSINPMSFHDRHEWTGGSSVPEVEPYPVVLEKDRLKLFVLPGPSKAGVVYVHNHRRWVLAWDSVNNKIHVECGHIGPIEWKAMEEKLDTSTNTNTNTSVFWDKITNAKAMGLIETSSSTINVISAFL